MKATLLLMIFSLTSLSSFAGTHTNGSDLKFETIVYGHMDGDDCRRDADVINKLSSERYKIEAKCRKVSKKPNKILGLEYDTESFYEISTKAIEK